MSQFARHTYFNTYYYANIVSNIISHRDPSLLGFISNFFDSDDTAIYLAKPFDKYSAFHKFIQHLIFEFFEDDMCDYDERAYANHTERKPIDPLYAELAFKNFDMLYRLEDFLGQRNKTSYEMIETYHDELRISGYLEELYERITKEVFYLLFNNRAILLQFNLMVSRYISEIIKADIENITFKKYFKKDGVLKRVNIPKWCQTAVYFRDRGRCCLCGCDLSSLFSTNIIKHFDHIVPLTLGGLNDVANIQLLCSKCNLLKSGSKVSTGIMYEFWY